MLKVELGRLKWLIWYLEVLLPLIQKAPSAQKELGAESSIFNHRWGANNSNNNNTNLIKPSAATYSAFSLHTRLNHLSHLVPSEPDESLDVRAVEKRNHTRVMKVRAGETFQFTLQNKTKKRVCLPLIQPSCASVASVSGFSFHVCQDGLLTFIINLGIIL